MLLGNARGFINGEGGVPCLADAHSDRTFTIAGNERNSEAETSAS